MMRFGICEEGILSNEGYRRGGGRNVAEEECSRMMFVEGRSLFLRERE